MKTEKVANQKLGNFLNLGNTIPILLISEFSILLYSRNQKLGFKKIAKKYQRFQRFSKFPSFLPGLIESMRYEITRFFAF